MSAGQHAWPLRGAAIWQLVSIETARQRLLFVLAALGVIGAVVLGGGTRPGHLSDAVLQLLMLPLLIIGAHRLVAGHPAAQARRAAVLALLVAAVPFLYLIPLPATVWSALPNRAPEVETFRLLGKDLPWMPASVAPELTWTAALSMIPPLSVFLAVLSLGDRERRWLCHTLLACAAASAFLGLMQLAQGPGSPLRFYQITNVADAVGFFANRNHFAALMYCAIAFAGAVAIQALGRYEASGRGDRMRAGVVLPVCAGFGLLVLFIAAEMSSRSRAGIIIASIALVAISIAAVLNLRGSDGALKAKPLAFMIVIAILFSMQYTLYRVLERLADDPLKDARVQFARTTAKAARAFFPVGSGVGTFVPVFAMFEDVPDILADTYANRAHNDILEWMLEAGAVGMAVLAALAIWYGVRVWRIVRAPPDDGHGANRLLVMSAALCVAMLAAHSLVDYPIRTSALATLLALCLALMCEPPPGSEAVPQGTASGRSGKRRSKRGGRRSAASSDPLAWRRPSEQSGAAPKPAEPPPKAAGRERWGDDVEWPEAWREPGKPHLPMVPKKPGGDKK